MGEYVREKHNKIQAGFALNAGKLLVQYEHLSEQGDQNYEATLLICVLHSLLTNCSELVESMRRHQTTFWSSTVYDVPQLFGISRRFVRKYTFPCELTYERFIDHMRNAVSHPSSAERKPFHPSTGYATIPDGSGIISRFSFVDSPWVDRGRIWSSACSADENRVKEFVRKFENRHAPLDHVVKRNFQGRYEIWKDDVIYIPMFESQLTLDSLRALAIGLANYLAQPTIADWDGEAIHRLVA